MKIKNIKEFFNTVLFALSTAFLFQTILFQPFKIPSGSMRPCLEVGDYLFVEKFSYGYNNSSFAFMLNRFQLFNGTYKTNLPNLGDVIVFLLPEDRSTHYIKRLVGLPGDKIQIKNNILYINDTPVKKTYLRKKIILEQNNVKCIKDVFEETLPNGVKYQIYIDSSTKKYYRGFDPSNTPIYTVPAGHYFFMGDNRDNSIDSRFSNVGSVPQDYLLGKAVLIFWTSDFSVLNFITKMQTGRAFKTII